MKYKLENTPEGIKEIIDRIIKNNKSRLIINEVMNSINEVHHETEAP